MVSLASLACCLSFSLDHLLVAPCTGWLLDCWLATVTWADYQREKSKVNDTVSDFSFIQRYWGTAEGEREVPVDCKITEFRNAHSTLSVSMAWCTFPPPQQPNFNILPTAQGHLQTKTAFWDRLNESFQSCTIWTLTSFHLYASYRFG